MAKKYEDFDESDEGGLVAPVMGMISRHKRSFAIVCVVGAVAAVGLLVWGAGSHRGQEAANESVPIVRADAGNYKAAPENPGGMDIPYRDSTVFAAGGSAGDDGKTENILADDKPEQPVSKKQVFAGLNDTGAPGGGSPGGTMTTGSPQTGGAPGASVPGAVLNGDTLNSGTPQTGGLPGDGAPGGTIINGTPQSATPGATSAPGGTVPGSTGVPGGSPQGAIAVPGRVAAVEPPSNDTLVKEAIGTNEPPVVKTATVTPPVAAMKATKVDAARAAKTEPASGSTAAHGVQPGGSYVQVASVRSADAAGGAFKALQAKFTVLNGLKYRTQEINLGAKGDFFRIQAGPMSKDSATSICNQMKKSAPGSCLIVAK